MKKKMYLLVLQVLFPLNEEEQAKLNHSMEVIHQAICSVLQDESNNN